MSYTSPSLADVLANEQLMNTRLTNLRTLLRTILDDLDIQYTSSNTVIELIRLLEKTYYCQIDENATTSKVSSVFGEHVPIRKVMSEEGSPAISFLQTSSAPNFAFSYHPVSGGSGMVTAASLLNNKTPFEGYNDWTLDYDMVAPSAGYYETNRGMCVLFNDNSPVPGASTYYGFCAGISINSRNVYAFVGKWNNTLTPTYTYSSATLTSGQTYHINVKDYNGSFTITITDANDNEVLRQSYDFYDDHFYYGGYNVRIGTYADWYAYEMPLYGTQISMKNILINY